MYKLANNNELKIDSSACCLLEDNDPMSLETILYYFKDLLNNWFVKFILSILASFAIYIHNHVHYSFYIVIILAFTDLITGIAKAIKGKRLSSFKAGKGVIKIFLYGLVVGIGVLMDYGIFHKLPEYYGFSWLFTSYIIVNLAISILENLACLGLPIPKELINYLNQVKNKVTKEESDKIIKIIK